MAKPPKKDEKEEDAPIAAAAESGEPGEGGEGLDGEEGKKKFSAKKIVIIALAVLILLGGAGAGLYFTGTLDKILHKGPVAAGAEKTAAAGCQTESAGEGEHGESSGESADGCDAGAVFLPIPDMLVNLSGDSDQPRYLRLSVELELADKKDLNAVKAVMPRVVDQFQTYLRELRVKDLRGSAGIYRLQMELLSRVNEAAYPVQVKAVLFQKILIQ